VLAQPRAGDQVGLERQRLAARQRPALVLGQVQREQRHGRAAEARVDGNVEPEPVREQQDDHRLQGHDSARRVEDVAARAGAAEVPRE
jgi:hypothetical protein